MTLDELYIFKSDLKMLTHLERQYNAVKAELDEMEYILQGVHGIDQSRIRNNKSHKDKRIELIEKKDHKQKYAHELKQRIDHTYSVLNSFTPEIKNILMDVYIKGVTIDNMSLKLNYSYSSVKRLIDRKIRDADYNR